MKSILNLLALLLFIFLTSCAKTSESPMSEANARKIALESSCLDVGGLDATATFDETSMTWLIDMTVTRPGCSPVCAVDTVRKTAQINWRCQPTEP